MTILCSGQDYTYIKYNLCGGDNAKVYAVNNSEGKNVLHHTRVKCGKCGLVYSNPQATETKMAEYYSEIYPKLMEADGKFKAIYDETFFMDSSDSALQMKPGKFLEVDCAYGIRIKTAERLEWEPHGVEISTTFCNIARDVLGIKKIFNGTLFERQYESSYFDYIILWHVLEHVQDPVKLFKEIEMIIKPGGILLIDVPNIHEPLYLINRINCCSKGQPYQMATSDHHTSEYTPTTLRKIVNNACASFVEDKLSVYYHKEELDSLCQMDMNRKGRLQIEPVEGSFLFYF